MLGGGGEEDIKLSEEELGWESGVEGGREGRKEPSNHHSNIKEASSFRSLLGTENLDRSAKRSNARQREVRKGAGKGRRGWGSPLFAQLRHRPEGGAQWTVHEYKWDVAIQMLNPGDACERITTVLKDI